MREEVRAEDVDLILQRQFGAALERIGFQPSARRRWSRGRVPQIRDVFEVATMKGEALSPRWGFSLDFTPHVTSAGVKWHRTAKSAILDVVDDPVDRTRAEDLERSPYLMFPTRGRDRLERDAEMSAEASLKEAGSFWDEVREERELLAVLERLRSRPVIRFGFDNYVQQPLALAFTLSRAGRMDQARMQLQNAHAYSAATAEVQRRLDELLESAASGR